YVAVLAREVRVRRGVLETDRDGLRETAARIHLPVEHVGDCAATGLPEQPPFDYRRNTVGEAAQPHDTTVRQHDDDVRIRQQYRVEQRDLAVREFEIVAVET